MRNDRRKYIGGSDVGAIIGVGFKSAFELWEQKTGKVEDEAPSLVMKIGIATEKTILDEYEALTQCTLARTIPLQSKQKDWARGEADGICIETNVGVDAKFTRVGVWDEIPRGYQAQAQWYMMMSECEAWDFAVLHASSPGEIKLYRLHRDESAIAFLLREAERFWQHVQSDTPPEPTSIYEVERYFKYTEKEPREEAVASHDFAELVEKARNIRTMKKELEDEERKIRAKIAYMTDGAEIVRGEDGKSLVRWLKKDGKRGSLVVL